MADQSDATERVYYFWPVDEAELKSTVEKCSVCLSLLLSEDREDHMKWHARLVERTG